MENYQGTCIFSLGVHLHGCGLRVWLGVIIRTTYISGCPLGFVRIFFSFFLVFCVCFRVGGGTFEKKGFVPAILFPRWPPPIFKACVHSKSRLL